jgi:DNA polymerase-3 subunit alpha
VARGKKIFNQSCFRYLPSCILAIEMFIHLHTHSSYSLLEGAISPEDLVDLAVDDQMPALAITDTNNLFGALEFSEKARKAGVQPIIGVQLDVNILPEDTHFTGKNHQLNRHVMPDQLVLLAQNEAGYQNLMVLASLPYLNRADGAAMPLTLDEIKNHAEGIICLSGGMRGPLASAIKRSAAQVKETLTHLIEIFPNRFYIEIQRHGLAEEQQWEDPLIDLAYEYKVPIVATNDVYFAREETYEAHDALLCIAAGRYVVEQDRRRETAQHYFRSAAEMTELFADLPEAIENTALIAQRCSYAPKKCDPILPPFVDEKNTPEPELLRQLSADGLAQRLAQMHIPPEDHAQYHARLNFELDVIIQMGFAGYFLIVADFIRWAKLHDIPVGPGRGSGAGSVVAWALTITDLNPLQFGLLFERFLNPERVSMPDFDIDFCQERRDEVIAYVRQKYGNERVAHIITFGKLQARAVLRDVGRVLQIPYPVVDRISKLVPNNPAAPVTLQQAIDGEVLLQEVRHEDENIARLMDYALQLEGLYRHASTHAAGVVIGDKPLLERIPLYKDPRSDGLVTQFHMKDVENIGLVKFDFLGLKTLTVLQYTLAYMRQRGITLTLEDIPFFDEQAFAMLSRGESSGVFQLESSGMRDVLRRMKPNRFEDIIALVALYRPGPMDNIPKYIAVKNGEETPDYLHPTLEPILRETYGVMIYQEQVMQVAQTLAGYSLGSADLLRRAMGKKIQSEMDAQEKSFVEGAIGNGVSADHAKMIFRQVDAFAGYGFNKSHAAAYALIAWQTAYLKAHYPVEFMAALMTLDLGDTDKLSKFRQELQRLKIVLLPPDINQSDAVFAVESLKDGALAIRYALGAIKGVGLESMRAMVADRKLSGSFKDLADIARRGIAMGMNKKQWEALSAAGAFDSIEKNRSSSHGAADLLLRYASSVRADEMSGQGNLFGDDLALAPPPVPETKPWPVLEALQEEFKAIGFYLSAHPLDSFGRVLTRLNVVRYADLPGRLLQARSSRVRLAGVVVSVQIKTAKSGNKFAFIQMSDASGIYEAVAFAETLLRHRDILSVGKTLLISADAQSNDDGVRLTLQEISLLESAASDVADGMMISLSSEKPLTALKDIVANLPAGKGDIFLVLFLPDGTRAEMQLPGRYRIPPAQRQALTMLPGVVGVEEI